MSNALAVLDQRPQVPAHIGSFFDESANIKERNTVPSLGYTGKVWAISVNGETTKLTKRTEDGDVEPVQIMQVVILDYNQKRGRTYYPGNYDPDKTSQPTCWSEDGITPHQSVKEKGAAKCSECPFAVKGSKVTDSGKATTACSQHRMVAVVPANKLDFTPLRLKLAITSDYDGQSPELEKEGWFAFSNYTDLLRTRGVKHTAALVTKMRFDPNVAYPKVLFSPFRWLNEQELATVVPLVKSDEVKQLLAGTYTPNGVDGEPIDEAPAPDPMPAAPVAPAPAPAAPKAAPKAKAPAAPKPAPKPAPATVVDDDDQFSLELPGVSAPAAPVAPRKTAAEMQAEMQAKEAAAPAPVSTEVPDDLAALLDEWGDD